MSGRNVLDFLATVAAQADVLDVLKVKSKSEVLDAARTSGYPFEEAEFDTTIWNLEILLAERRGEEFGPDFDIWHLMWGQYYLEYLVVDLLPNLVSDDVEAVLTSHPTSGQRR